MYNVLMIIRKRRGEEKKAHISYDGENKKIKKKNTNVFFFKHSGGVKIVQESSVCVQNYMLLACVCL